MKKSKIKLFNIIMATLILGIFTSCNKNTNIENNTNNKIEQINLNDNIIDDVRIEFKDYRMGKDMLDNPILIIKYNLYNNSSNVVVFDGFVNDQVYLNNQKLNLTSAFDTQYGYALKPIKPNESITVERGYKLPEDSNMQTGNVEVDITKWFQINNIDVITFNFEI